jgi:hypothetical protein
VLAVCCTPFAICLFLTLTFVVSPLPTSTIIFSNAHLNMLLEPTSLRCTVAFFFFFLIKEGMCLLYLQRIHGCASNTLRAKDPQYIDHLILVCRWLFEFYSFSAIKRVTKTCPGQKVRNGCLTETNHKHEREWWKGGRIGVYTATLATSFLDILGDPNLSPLGTRYCRGESKLPGGRCYVLV